MNSFLHHFIWLKGAKKGIVWVLQLSLLAVLKSNNLEIYKILSYPLI